MPTKPIGSGTCNLSINVRLGVRAALGRMAFLQDVSMGEFCRRLMAVGANIVRAFKIADRQHRRALLLETRLRGIVADGMVTEIEIMELRRECVPAAHELAAGAARVGQLIQFPGAKEATS